jgi:hypothetical protein
MNDLGQPSRCKICGYNFQWGDILFVHTIEKHPREFILKVLFELPESTQDSIFKKNHELLE